MRTAIVDIIIELHWDCFYGTNVQSMILYFVFTIDTTLPLNGLPLINKTLAPTFLSISCLLLLPFQNQILLLFTPLATTTFARTKSRFLIANLLCFNLFRTTKSYCCSSLFHCLFVKTSSLPTMPLLRLATWVFIRHCTTSSPVLLAGLPQRHY